MKGIRRGKRVLLERVAFQTLDGEKIEVFVHRFDGAEPGPTVYVGAATHGNELHGVEVCRLLVEELSTRDIRGRLFVIPIQNPIAYKLRVRLNPIDGKDLDRLYPGKNQGTATETLANLLFEFASEAECVIDLHSGGVGSKNIPHIYVPSLKPTRTQFSSLALAKAFGGDTLIDTRKGVDYHFDLDHPSPFYCNTLGSAGLYVELGEGGRVDDYFVDFGLRGVQNVLVKLGMISGKIEEQGKLEVVTKTTVVHAKTPGILRRKYEVGQEVKERELLAEVHGVFGGSEKIRSPVNGTVQWTVTFGNVGAGDDIAWIGHN